MKNEYLKTGQEKIQEMPLKEYLQASLKCDDTGLCRDWEYLGGNLTPELKQILNLNKYWDLQYNDKKVNFILERLGIKEIEQELKKQLGSFVYIYNNKKREQEKADREQAIIEKGYTKISHTQKELEGKKVNAVMYVSKIGMLGSFDSLEEVEGKLTYSDRFNALMLIPKRSRTKGYIIKDYAFIKEVIK